MKSIDKGNINHSIFVDLPKTFDTVEHGILLSKLGNDGISGITNDWKQFVSINGYVSIRASLINDVPQGSILEPLKWSKSR